MARGQGNEVATGLFVGLSTVDLGYLVPNYPTEDSKVTAQEQVTTAGGPATNAAVAYSFLSAGGARLVTALGEHWLTRVVRDDLDSHDVTVVDLTPNVQALPPASSIIVSQETASRTIVSLDATRTHAPVPDSPDQLVGDAKVVLVDGHLVGSCLAVARAARIAGIPVVFDGGRWKDTHRELLQYVDIAIVSGRFAPPEAEDVHEFLHGLGVEFAATTDGAGLIHWSAPDQADVVSVPSVAAVDTLGAGDIFHGAFCYYFSERGGRDFPEALGDAAAVAAASCERFGTRAWMESGRGRFPAR